MFTLNKNDNFIDTILNQIEVLNKKNNDDEIKFENHIQELISVVILDNVEQIEIVKQIKNVMKTVINTHQFTCVMMICLILQMNLKENDEEIKKIQNFLKSKSFECNCGNLFD